MWYNAHGMWRYYQPTIENIKCAVKANPYIYQEDGNDVKINAKTYDINIKNSLQIAIDRGWRRLKIFNKSA